MAALETRDQAKTAIYQQLYGAGANAVGAFLRPTADPEEQRKAGLAAKRNLGRAIPALRQLEKDVKLASKRGFIRGLDGRRLVVRSEHAALNVLLQSAGAIVCKYWVCEIERLMLERGFKHGRDGDFMMSAWVHDEVQVAVRPHAEEALAACVHEAIANAESRFKFNCPLAASPMFGDSWAQTH